MPTTASKGSGAPTLLLIPTELERRRLLAAGQLPPGLALQALCGFGPVVAAARTAELLARLAPARVLLAGIAGAYDIERDPLGSVRRFGTVAIDGVGAGAGDGFLGPAALGFDQWPAAPRIAERLPLAELPATEHHAPAAELLTVCAAAGSEAEARRRVERFPAAAAEDMEAFAVASACALAGVPCAVLRGISNRAGDRDTGGWAIDAALDALRAALVDALSRPWPPNPDRA